MSVSLQVLQNAQNNKLMKTDSSTRGTSSLQNIQKNSNSKSASKSSKKNILAKNSFNEEATTNNNPYLLDFNKQHQNSGMQGTNSSFINNQNNIPP